MNIEQVILLAAGYGERMRPLTDTCPKPLLCVNGEALIDLLLRHLRRAGAKDFTINAFYLSEQLESHFSDYSDCCVLVESELLESGGAIVNAIQSGALTDNEFWAVNGDSLWEGGDSLEVMQELWDSERMDGLLMLCPLDRAHGYDGAGDFTMEESGELRRLDGAAGAGYVFCGVQILRADIFRDLSVEYFSLNRIYDEAILRDRLYGFIHGGEWWHVGTPQALAACEKKLAKRL